MKKLTVAALIIFIAACKNGKDKVETVDSLQMVREITGKDSTLIFNKHHLPWINNNHIITHEESWKEDSMPFQPFGGNQEFYNNYKSVLRWSPDSTKVLDIGSYGLVVVRDKDGNVTLEAGEPDTEIALIDRRKNARARLMFVGPSSEVLSASWINKSDAMIAGTFDATGNGKKDTLIWMIRVDDMFFRLYNLKTK